MKANVQYNDFTGTASADISDRLGAGGGGDMEGLAKVFNIDENRFKPVGISLYGVGGFIVSLICVDNEKSTDEKEHIVKMSCNIDNEKDIIDIIFKRLNIVLYDKYDKKYSNLDYDEEVRYSDFH
ncbi:hypothetical protein [uncultured Dokdonia sp.]|uniref:hypothetical protein n=1 Tax=uncultured Dokdonia sp. TaxID=575653 RepID=UPI0026169AF2|nr:hypothetical protein [uncultured Dokdonia sp.]